MTGEREAGTSPQGTGVSRRELVRLLGAAAVGGGVGGCADGAGAAWSAPAAGSMQASLSLTNAEVGCLATLSELRALDPATAPHHCYVVLGYHGANDGGGGVFYWDADSSATDDAGLVFEPDGWSGVGRWHRLLAGGALHVRWFGAKGDGIANDLPAIRNAVAACPVGSVVVLDTPPAFYRVYDSDTTVPLIEIRKSLTFTGEGALSVKATSGQNAVSLECRDENGGLVHAQPMIVVEGDVHPVLVELKNFLLMGGTHGILWGNITHRSEIDNVGMVGVGAPGSDTSAGLEITGNSIGAIFRRLQISANGTPAVGIHIPASTWAHQTRWLDCRVAGTKLAALRVSSASPGTHELLFDNFITESNKGAAYEISGGVRMNFRQAHFEKNGLLTGDPDIRVEGQQTHNVAAMLNFYGGSFSAASSGQSERIKYTGARVHISMTGTRINGSDTIDGTGQSLGSAFRGIALLVPPKVLGLGRVHFFPDPNEIRFHEEAETLTNAPTVIAEYAVPAGRTVMMEVNVVCNASDDSFGGVFKRIVCAKRSVGGVVSIVGGAVDVFTVISPGAPGTLGVALASYSTAMVQVVVTGANQALRWSVDGEVTQV